MFYRITVDLSFPDLDTARDIWEELARHFNQAVNINPGQVNEERGSASLVECHHDESPTLPCEELRIHTIG